MIYNLTSSSKHNAEWEVISEDQYIQKFKLKVLGSKALEDVEKSSYVYIVTLNRNPMMPMIYLIVPTVIISVFNNLAYLIPGNGGIFFNKTYFFVFFVKT